MGIYRRHIEMFAVTVFASVFVFGSVVWGGAFSDPNSGGGLKVKGDAKGTKLEGPMSVENKGIVADGPPPDFGPNVAVKGTQVEVRLRQGNNLATFVSFLDGPVDLTPSVVQNLIINAIGPDVVTTFFGNDAANGVCFHSEDPLYVPTQEEIDAGACPNNDTGITLKVKAVEEASTTTVVTGLVDIDPPNGVFANETSRFDVLDVDFAADQSN